jgi:hypothetical protein
LVARTITQPPRLVCVIRRDSLFRAATWRSGYAAACKAVYTGSIPVVALASTWERLVAISAEVRRSWAGRLLEDHDREDREHDHRRSVVGEPGDAVIEQRAQLVADRLSLRAQTDGELARLLGVLAADPP